MMTTSQASLHAKDLPHALEFASMEEELVAQASHTHAIYCKDNVNMYFLLEEATKGTQYAASMKLFQ
eukprot:15290648-Ditylum_brightwellii.AAC.2